MGFHFVGSLKMPKRRRDEPACLPENINQVITIEQVYQVVNFALINSQTCSFIVNFEDSFIVNNILEDSNIKSVIEVENNQCKYIILPPVKTTLVEDQYINLDDDEFEDEIVEQGQCF